MLLIDQAKAAKDASYMMMKLSSAAKDSALLAMADALEAEADAILKANALDVKAAREKGRTESIIDRLTLTKARISAMAGGLRKVSGLPDPIGRADWVEKRPNGLTIECRRVPLGVIGIIFEARPNVTADAIGLCLKSGNCCVLRGGSEAIHSNSAITDIMTAAAEAAGLPKGAVQLVRDTSHESAVALMTMTGLIDVIIPRGGAGLIKSVVENAKVPVIETGVGNCHVYVDVSADLDMASEIVFNAKTSRPSVCYAVESLLVHASVADRFLPLVAEKLAAKNVELRGCARTRAILPEAVPATEEDWAREYLDYILSIKVVDSLEEAVSHINRYGTKHSEAIVTKDYDAAQYFLDAGDAAAVYVNASTRFTDGEEFGFGAEIGISTQKLHARGPMGLKELTSVKYAVRGCGQIR
jgi:glutamate-5-semialdehyde dehydrogenase